LLVVSAAVEAGQAALCRPEGPGERGGGHPDIRRPRSPPPSTVGGRFVSGGPGQREPATRHLERRQRRRRRQILRGSGRSLTTAGTAAAVFLPLRRRNRRCRRPRLRPASLCTNHCHGGIPPIYLCRPRCDGGLPFAAGGSNTVAARYQARPAFFSACIRRPRYRTCARAGYYCGVICRVQLGTLRIVGPPHFLSPSPGHLPFRTALPPSGRRRLCLPHLTHRSRPASLDAHHLLQRGLVFLVRRKRGRRGIPFRRRCWWWRCRGRALPARRSYPAADGERGDRHRDKESKPRRGHASSCATNSGSGFAAIGPGAAAVVSTAFVHPDVFSLVLAPGNSLLRLVAPPTVGTR
ncbi:unnamed protein product, partial [Ectocarpus fasciculatus]